MVDMPCKRNSLTSPVLQGLEQAFYPALGLRGVGRNQFCAQLVHGPAEPSQHPGIEGAPGIDRIGTVPVQVDAVGFTLGRTVIPPELHDRYCTLVGDEPQVHPVAGIIYCCQQSTSLRPVLEPIVFGAVELDHLAHAVFAFPVLPVLGPAASRPPHIPVNHQPAQGLSIDMHSVLLVQFLGRQGGTEVGKVLPNQLDNPVLEFITERVVPRFASQAVRQAC